MPKDELAEQIDSMLEMPVPKTEVAAAEVKPTEVKPAEVVPEVKSVEVAISEVKPGEVKPVEVKSVEVVVSPDDGKGKEEVIIEGEESREDLLSRINLLTNRIEDLTFIQPRVVSEVVPKVEPKVVAAGEATGKPADIGPVDFIGSQSIDELIDDKEKLNKVFNSIYTSAIVVAEKNLMEKIAPMISSDVSSHVRSQSVVNELVSNFYKSNEDLRQVKRTVAAVATDVHSEHPDWSVEDVFKEAGVRTRKLLGLKRIVKRDNNPAFVDSGGGKPPIRPKAAGGLQDEINELLTH